MKLSLRVAAFFHARYTAFLDTFRVTKTELEWYKLGAKIRYHQKHGKRNRRYLLLFAGVTLPVLIAELYYLLSDPCNTPYQVIFGLSIALWPIPTAIFTLKIVRHWLKLKGYKKIRPIPPPDYLGQSDITRKLPAPACA